MKFNFASLYKQRGVTLLEALAGLAILFTIMGGVLALNSMAQSSTNSITLLKDITALRTATQGLYNQQGGYGTASINQSLITASKVPTDLTISGTTINTSNGGTITITGNTTNFTIALTDQTADICTQLLSASISGWKSVQINTGTAITVFPISPATATDASNCGGTAPFTLTWTTSS